MKEKAVLYVGGGAMAGVFGAGVVTGLQESEAYEKFSHAYGASAGAWDIAYFLSMQSLLGSSIYWDDLPQGFINLRKIPKFLMNLFLGIHEKVSIVDIDYLVRVAQTNKHLDVETIQASPLEAFVKTYNLSMEKSEWKSLKDEPLKRLKESSSILPYYFDSGQQCVDGAVVDSTFYTFLRKRHPHQKIVAVLNYSPFSSLSSRLKHSLEGFFNSILLEDNSLMQKVRNRRLGLEEEVRKIKEDNRALLLFPPRENPTRHTTTNPLKLKRTHEMGRVMAQRILDFIGK